MSEWQPIETAPKDGSIIIISDGDTPVVGLWSVSLNCWIVEWDHAGFDEPPPSLWAPLPEPPK